MLKTDSLFKRKPFDLRILLFQIGVLTGLYLTTKVNYLLFHALAEVFSIVVAFSVFVITWNSRKYFRNNALLIIGTAYLFIGFIDLMHTLSYPGMTVFTDYSYYANQLWIGARYLESLTLVAALILLSKKIAINIYLVFIIYLAAAALLILSVYVWKIFPVCFVKGSGLTPFKKISEYIICAVLLTALVLLAGQRDSFDKQIYRLLSWSIIFTVISELAFTFYIDNYGLSNIVGHFFKIFSFYLIYKAMIQTGIIDPYDLIFREIDTLNRKLNRELDNKRQQELDREKLILELKDALAKVKQLGGLLPICMHCKNIRDDQGYWNEIEEYISNHSEADFSHSICPDCMAKYYPDVKDKS